jgi:serine/threonine protein kinase
MAEPETVLAGRYRLVRVLGSGGMGVVWEARDERLRRSVAVKQLRTQPGLDPAAAEVAKQRAMREARITARLQHPNAIAVFDVVEHEGQPCLAMQLVPSVPLTEVLRELEVLHHHEAARLGAQVAAALAEAHRLGIVHRDVKPGNVLVGDDGTARISDFGISRALGDATLTTTGMVTGTPAYLAPEVARGGESTPASDVFSLGATLYAAVEGAPPFGADSNVMALLLKVAAGELDPPRRAGPLAPLLLRMLARDPRDRPAMAEVAETLAALAAADAQSAPAATAPTPAAATLPAAPGPEPADLGPTVTRHPDEVPTAAATSRRRRPALLLAAAGVLAALLALAAVLLPRGGDDTALPEPGAASASRTSVGTTSPTPAGTTPASEQTTQAPPSSTDDPSTGNAPTAAQLARAISDYYALLPDDVRAAWPRMTPSYQRSPAGGFESYAEFWSKIEEVNLTQVRGLPPAAAEATVTYVFTDKDRAPVRERTRYGLVAEDGMLKIDSSRVLSSTTG